MLDEFVEAQMDQQQQQLHHLHHHHHQYRQQKDEVDLLLEKWRLPELKNKFKEQEITIRSLQFLTKEDISELIPKIGPRAIFRARLFDWQQQQQKAIHKSPSSTQSGNSTIYSYSMPASIVKVESGYEEDDDDVVEISRIRTEHDDVSSNSLTQLDFSSANLLASTLLSLPKETTHTEGDDGSSSEIISNIDRQHTSPPPPTHQEIAPQLKLDIRSALLNNVDGRQAIEFYEANGKLDYANRKRIVSVIVNSAIDKNVWMCSSEFKRMADEIIQIFPNESYFTYYIPRDGAQNPRGALYNKFLNMSRKLRQEGLMQYRRISPNSTIVSPNCTLRSSRNFKQYAVID